MTTHANIKAAMAALSQNAVFPADIRFALAHLRDALPESEKAFRESSVRCPECGRVFDLTNKNDANEWSFGHDCE